MTANDRPRRTGFQLSQLGHLASRQFSESVSELGLTPPEAGVLRLLARNPGISQRDLAQRLGAVPSRVVVLLDALQDAGLVTRTRSVTDRRNHELELTDEGRAMMVRLRRVAEHHEGALVEGLSERERSQLARLVDKLASAHGLSPDAHPGFGRPPS
jgi:DNA-binding MarR family transcriptional regulator